MLEYVAQGGTPLCSFLVVVPGHPEHGPFYLVTGLLNVLQVATLA